MIKELEAGIITEKTISCADCKWGDDDPPRDRGTFCASVLERKMNSVGNTTGSQLETEIIGRPTNLAMPFAVTLTGMLWDIHRQYHIRK